jgi:hypothetical protein
MNKKLYVGNLSYNTTEVTSALSLRRQVRLHRWPSSWIVRRVARWGLALLRWQPKRPRKGIEALNGKELGRRNITVAEARPPREREGGFGGGGRSSGGGGRGGFGGGRDREGGFGGGRDDYGDRRRRF